MAEPRFVPLEIERLAKRLPARGCRASSRSRDGWTRRSRARPRTGHAAEEASRCGRSRLGRRGSARTRQPHRGAEGGRASAVPTRSRETYHMDGLSETRGRDAGAQFATKRSGRREPAISVRVHLALVGLRRRPTAAPRTPVAARAYEVAVRCDRLLAGALSVAEQTALGRPHLEEAQVLAVLGGCPQA